MRNVFSVLLMMALTITTCSAVFVEAGSRSDDGISKSHDAHEKIATLLKDESATQKIERAKYDAHERINKAKYEIDARIELGKNDLQTKTNLEKINKEQEQNDVLEVSAKELEPDSGKVTATEDEDEEVALLDVAASVKRVGTSKPVLGYIETVLIKGKKVEAKVDTGAYRTSIDKDLVKKLTLKVLKENVTVMSANGSQTRPLVEVTMKIAGKTIVTKASVADRSNMEYPIIIGRKDMGGFLIDPSIQND